MPTPTPIPRFHAAKLRVHLFAGFVMLWKLGAGFKGKVSGVFEVEKAELVPPVLGVVLFYQLIDAAIGWAQSDTEAREETAARVEALFTAASGFTALGFLVHGLCPTFVDVRWVWPALSWWSALFLVGLGSALAFLANNSIYLLLFIRPKDEARALSLPRVPMAVKAGWRMARWSTLLLVPLIFMAPSYSSPMDSWWYWLVGSPLAVGITMGLLSLASHRFLGSKRGISARVGRIRRVRNAFDQHDASYQRMGFSPLCDTDNARLYEAAQNGDVVEIERCLLEADDPDVANEHGWTALMIAAANQQEMAVNAILEFGANPNSRNIQGCTALIFASMYGNLSIVNRLLSKGAVPDDEDHSLWGPGALAVAALHGHDSVVDALLAAGARPDVKDADGCCPLDYATRGKHGHIAKRLRLAMTERTGDGG